MKSDPAIDEIRETRRKISAESGHEPRRLMAHYVQYENKLKREGKYRFVKAASSEVQIAVVNAKPVK